MAKAHAQGETARWEEETLRPFLEKRAERKSKFVTVSNEEIDRLYTIEDLEDLDPNADLSHPGHFPYTRGVYESMYRGRLWTMRQFAGFGTAEATNRRFHYLLDHGQTGLSTAFDMPTLMGYDSDHAMSHGEVGVEGVAVDTLKDLEVLFKGIRLDEVSTSFTINPSAPAIFAMYVALADQQGVPRGELRGTIQNDMLKEFIAQKEWVTHPRPSVNLVVDTFEFGVKETPRFNVISISGYHIREAGATAIQELAFTLANGFAYVEAALQRGLDVDEIAPQLSFFFNSHLSFFEEIAKFRAARRIWAREMKTRYGAKQERSLKLRFHTQTAGVTLTEQQPMNNIVRVALQALAAVLGGTQSLHTNSFDEALALPTEEAAKLALRTQQIIAGETGVADTIDPLGGSYFVEALTTDTEAKAMDYIHRIERMGGGRMLEGVLSGIDEGFFQREIARSAYEYQQQVERGEQTIVGVNKFVEDGGQRIPLLKIDPAVETHQVQSLKDVKAARDAVAVAQTLSALKRAAEDGENTMPFLIEAVKAYASVGEIMDVFRTVHGVYREPSLV